MFTKRIVYMAMNEKYTAYVMGPLAFWLTGGEHRRHMPFVDVARFHSMIHGKATNISISVPRWLSRRILKPRIFACNVLNIWIVSSKSEGLL